MSSTIQQVSSAPTYISEFIAQNMKTLQDIYEEGIQHFQSGCLAFQCSQQDNVMNVQFSNDDRMCEIIQKDSWISLKNGIPKGKRLFYVVDQDLHSVFLIYV
jgi:hypothetical protein